MTATGTGRTAGRCRIRSRLRSITTPTSCPTTGTSSMTEPAPLAAAPGALRPAAPVSLGALALAFLKIAMASLGGGLSAWALRVIVEERRWLTEQEFLAAFTICRIAPGPNQVNMAVYVGT